MYWHSITGYIPLDTNMSVCNVSTCKFHKETELQTYDKKNAALLLLCNFVHVQLLLWGHILNKYMAQVWGLYNDLFKVSVGSMCDWIKHSVMRVSEGLNQIFNPSSNFIEFLREGVYTCVS